MEKIMRKKKIGKAERGTEIEVKIEAEIEVEKEVEIEKESQDIKKNLNQEIILDLVQVLILIDIDLAQNLAKEVNLLVILGLKEKRKGKIFY